jgi:hypothetical protein
VRTRGQGDRFRASGQTDASPPWRALRLGADHRSSGHELRLHLRPRWVARSGCGVNDLRVRLPVRPGRRAGPPDAGSWLDSCARPAGPAFRLRRSLGRKYPGRKIRSDCAASEGDAAPDSAAARARPRETVGNGSRWQDARPMTYPLIRRGSLGSSTSGQRGVLRSCRSIHPPRPYAPRPKPSGVSVAPSGFSPPAG